MSDAAGMGPKPALLGRLASLVGTLCLVNDADARLASDLSLAVMRLARQLRFRRPESPVSLSQLSALATLAKDGPMTPGALAIRERVRPPSMTRVIASLADLGFVDRAAHPDDGRQVLVSVSDRRRADRGGAPRQPGVAAAAAGELITGRARHAAAGRRPDVALVDESAVSDFGTATMSSTSTIRTTPGSTTSAI